KSCRPDERQIEDRSDELTDVRLRRGPRARHVQDTNVVLPCELPEPFSGIAPVPIVREMEPRLSVLPRQLGRLPRAARQRPSHTQDHRPVRVTDIPLRSLQIALARRLLQAIPAGDRPVLRSSSSRAPPSMRDAARDGPAERRAVRSRLAPRDYPDD